MGGTVAKQAPPADSKYGKGFGSSDVPKEKEKQWVEACRQVKPQEACEKGG